MWGVLEKNSRKGRETEGEWDVLRVKNWQHYKRRREEDAVDVVENEWEKEVEQKSAGS